MLPWFSIKTFPSISTGARLFGLSKNQPFGDAAGNTLLPSL
jgi:hypothetical protein